MLKTDRVLRQWSRLALCVGGSLLAAACSEEETPEPVIRPVRYTQVYASGDGRVRVFSGQARAAVESRLSFKVGGTVTHLEVQVGDRVQAGQLLAELDDRDLRLQVEEAQARLNSARAQAQNAAAAYSRVRALYENRNASTNDLDAARAANESALESVNSVAKSLELAEAQLGYARLVAQTDGDIAGISVEVNENVAPGQAVALLSSGERLEVEVAVPEVLIAGVREGDEVEVSFDAVPGRTFVARVAEVSVSSAGMATTYPVTVQLINAEPDCRPGMAAEVGFRSAAGGRPVIVVPSVAVGEDRQGRFVFVVEPGEDGLGVTRRREVVVGEMPGDGLEILEGLTDGDRVVTAGVTRIVDGQTVRLLGAS